MKRRAVPITAEVDDRDLAWLAEAGSYRAAFTAMREPGAPAVRGIDDLHALRRSQLAEARDWCAARGLNHRATVAAVRRKQDHERETR